MELPKPKFGVLDWPSLKTVVWFICMLKSDCLWNIFQRQGRGAMCIQQVLDFDRIFKYVFYIVKLMANKKECFSWYPCGYIFILFVPYFRWYALCHYQLIEKSQGNFLKNVENCHFESWHIKKLRLVNILSKKGIFQ